MEMAGEMPQDSIEDVLAAQVRTIGILRDSQRRLLDCVKKRDWTLLVKEGAVIEELSAEFEGLEAELARLLPTEAKEGERASFYRATAALPKERRQAVNGLFRELKRELVLSKTESMSIARYVAGERASLSGLLEHIVPQAKARTYTKGGSLSSGLEEGIVLDAVF